VSEYCSRLTLDDERHAFAASRCGTLVRYGLPRSQYYCWTPRRHLAVSFPASAPHGDLLLYPGADITAWVDYTLLAGSFPRSRLHAVGFTTQSFFRRASG